MSNTIPKREYPGHTPGDWWLGPRVRDMDQIVVSSKGQVCALEPSRLIDRDEAECNGRLIADAPILLRERNEYADRIAELEVLVQQSLSCITQGRVAFDDEQDMTDWYVAAAELQARLEAATEAQHD
jgi:hypothetical protein